MIRLILSLLHTEKLAGARYRSLSLIDRCRVKILDAGPEQLGPHCRHVAIVLPARPVKLSIVRRIALAHALVQLPSRWNELQLKPSTVILSSALIDRLTPRTAEPTLLAPPRLASRTTATVLPLVACIEPETVTILTSIDAKRE